MQSIGERLREERERLGLSQTAYAEHIGITKRSVYSWEMGNTAPSVRELMRLAEIGVDMVYVLTGRRESALLSREETVLVDHYRHSSPGNQHILRETGAAFAQPVSGRRRKAG